MHAAQRDVGALVLVQVEHTIVAGDLGHARHHDPVLGALAVFLQAQCRARLDHDALDLEAVANADRVVAAPGPVHLAVEQVLLPARGLDLVDDLFHVLDAILARHQRRIGRVDDDQVLDPDGRDHAAVRCAHQAVAGVDRQHIAFVAVAIRVAVGRGPQRRPRTDVAPAAADRHHGRTIRLLHDGIVDRIVRTGRERVTTDPDEVQIGFGRSVGIGGRSKNLRRVTTERIEIALCLEQEHAGIPDIAPVVDVGLRRRQVGLLDETADAVAALGQFLAAGDVAIPDFRPIGVDAERHQPILVGQHRGPSHRVAECNLILDQVIGGKNQHGRLRVIGQQVQRRNGDRRRGIARHRFQQDATMRHPDLLELLTDHETMVLAANGDRRLHIRQRVRAQHGLLVQRTITDQRQELLGLVLSRQRPQPGPAAAAENDRVKHRNSVCA